MAIDSGTINSATPVDVLRQKIQDVFTAHSNWTLEDTVVITTNTYYVYKNHGTGVTDNNSYGQNFYLVLIQATAGTGSLTIKAFEDYNLGSDLMIRPVMEDASNATNADTSGLATGGVVLSTTSGPFIVTITPAVAPNTSDYYIVASKNVLHVALRRSDVATVYSCYAGLFESRVTIANEFPLCLGVNVQGNSNATGGTFATSRHPGRISQAATANNFRHDIAAPQTSGDTSNVDLFRGKAQASKASLRSVGGATVANAPTFGRLRGTLYDVAILPAASGVTPGMGDVLDDISSDNHWYFGYGGLDAWVNQAAV